jgi:predicted CoA-binding protein
VQLRRENFADPGDIDAILNMSRVAVVGLSSDPSRHSFAVALYLQRHGYEITPVNPNETEVLGQRAYDRLQDLPEPPEVVEVFRRPEFVNEVVDDAIAASAKTLWIQTGIINYEAARKAREAGLIVVMDRCMMVEHARRRRE